MKIRINKEIIKQIKDEGFRANEIGSVIFILLAIHHSELEMLDVFDEDTKDKTALTLYKVLEMKGLIKKDNVSNSLYQLSFNGETLVNKINNVEIEAKTPEIQEEPLMDFVQRWLALWKDNKGIYYRDGKRSLGSTERDIFNKFQSFFSDYQYVFSDLKFGLTPRQVIMEATKNYIEELKKKNFEYCKGSDGFIWKQEGATKNTKKSMLAVECQDYIAKYGKQTPTVAILNKAL